MRGVAADRRRACDGAEVSGNRWLPRTTCVGCAAGCSGAFLPPPSPPAEKATARQDQAGKASTGDGAGVSSKHLALGIKVPQTPRYHPTAQIRQGAEPNATCRVGADGETGDFKGLTLFQLGPRLLRKPGLFLQARRGSRRRPDRRGLEPAAGTCRDATGMARQDRDNPSKTGGFKPVKLQLWLANREEEWGKKKWR